MKDVIRKAVELADDWKLEYEVGGRRDEYITSADGFWGPMSEALEKRVLLDALAAQLVRQCDEKLKDWRCLELFLGHTAVRRFEPLSDIGEDIAACYGKGRTMNTINAIVESGVLE